MKKINQSGPFGRCLAGDAALTEEERARLFSMAGDAVEMKHRLAELPSNFVFASSDRDALKPDNGDRRFAAIDRQHAPRLPFIACGNAQMEFYRTMLGEAWPDANTDASLFGEPDIIVADEPMRTLQMREEVDLIAAHLKALPPIPPVPRELRFLAGGTFGKTSPRPWSHIYQDALDYFDEASSFPDVRLRAFGKSLPGALFRSGDPLKFIGGNYAGHAITRSGQKRDIAMERVHHHVDHWTVRRRFKGMIDSLPKRLRMAIIIHRAFRGPL